MHVSQIIKIKRITFRIVSCILSILILLLIAEVILRIHGSHYYQFNNNSQEYYTNPRGYHIPIRHEGTTPIYGLHYMTSAEGYRLPDAPFVPINTSKNSILGLGDSFTYGRGVRYKDSYLFLLQTLLNHNGYTAGIKNCGIVGANISEVAATFLHESAQTSYPLVIYGFVLNDFGIPSEIKGSDFIDQNNGGITYNPLRHHFYFFDFIHARFERYYLHHRTVHAYQAAFQGKSLTTNFNRLRNLNEDILAQKGILVIVLFPLLYNFDHYPFQEIHQTIASFCSQENIPLLDLLPTYSVYKAESLWANPTDHHPNELAHQLTAFELYRYITKHKELLNKITAQS